MGRAPCCDDTGLKKGPWTPEEDEKLVEHIQNHGHGSWRKLPKLAGLNRCGKSCRLRWTNYLRPDIKRGNFTEEEERLVIHLHSVLGNKWSAIAIRLPGRTDNEIKNYWNTHLRKKLLHMGIDPVTHRPRADLNLLANLPSLLASVNSGGNLTNPWDNALRLQADAAQLARMQLLQGLIQVLSPNSQPNLEAINLMGSGFLRNYPSNDHLQMNLQSQIIDNTLGLVQGSLNQYPLNLSNSGITLSPDDFQFPSETCLPLDRKEMVSQIYNGSCSNTLAVDPNTGSDNQMSSPYTNPTGNSTPSLVSASSENLSIDQLQDLMNPNDVTADSSTTTTFNAWGGLNLDDLDSDFNWKDILDQATLSAWPTST